MATHLRTIMRLRCLFGHRWEPWERRWFGHLAMDERFCLRCRTIETKEVDDSISRAVHMAQALEDIAKK